jgi:hypothetical protein
VIESVPSTLCAHFVQLLWAIDVSLVRWTLFVIGTTLTSLTLMFALWPALRSDLLSPAPLAPAVLAGAVVLHCALVLVLKV